MKNFPEITIKTIYLGSSLLCNQVALNLFNHISYYDRLGPAYKFLKNKNIFSGKKKENNELIDFQYGNTNFNLIELS